MTEKAKIEIGLLLPTVPDTRDACVQRLAKSKDGVETAHLVEQTVMKASSLSPRSSFPLCIESSNIRYRHSYCDETFQHLRHACPADAEEAGECRPALELASVQKRLVVTSQSEWVANRLTRVVAFVFACKTSVPRIEFDDRLAT